MTLQTALHDETSGSPEIAASDEGALRADAYRLLAALLRDVPRPELLDRLQGLEPGGGKDEYAMALSMLRLAASRVSAAEVDDEYHELFIGVGRGELVPYGSWYLTGFLMEKPLSLLRQDLALLGFERQEGVHEPEDHIGALCEVMAMLATAEDCGFATSKGFFERHLAPWGARFFHDLQNARAATFYKAVGSLGEAFMRLEERYFEMEV